jgi:TolA-binding protein
MSSLHPARWRGHHLRASGLALLLLLSACAAAGCSTTSFVGRQYDNFTAYYNTYYNATKAFEEGVEAVGSQQDAPVSLSRYVAVFERPARAGQTASFEEAIDKCASILREHPSSKWADDALLLIGKSYFYQQNDVGAEQKFREVIDLGTEKEGEARFWLARTLVASRRPEAASEALRNGLDGERDFGEWTDRMYLVRGQLRTQNRQWTDAEAALDRGLERGNVPGDVAARAALLLGQVRETLGRMGAAAAAYDRAADASSYELAYAGQVSALRVRGLHSEPERSLARLQSLLRNDKNIEKRAELLLLRGRLLWADGRPEEARAALRGILYSEESTPRGRVRGRVHYALARLYRDAWNDFQRAAAHFDTAATDLQPLAQQDENANTLPPSPVATNDSPQQAERYGILAERSKRVARLDSLLRLGRMPPEAFNAFVADLRAKRAAEAEARRRAQARQASARRFASQSVSTRQARSGTATSSGTGAAGVGTAGFLFHEDPVRLQEGRRNFERVWGDRPRVENWRRLAAISGGTQSAAAEAMEADTVATPNGTAATSPSADATDEPSAVGVDVSAVPRTPEDRKAMADRRAVARYELANALFLAAERPDSAATWYRRVLDDNADHPVAQRALYALAEAEGAMGNQETATRLYRRVIQEHPNSAFAQRARQQVGEASAPADNQGAASDSAYAQAYESWQRQQWEPALQRLRQVVRTYPETPAAPRALLAAVTVAGHWKQHADSSATVVAALRRFVGGLPDLPEAAEDSATSAAAPGGSPDASSQRASRDVAPPDTSSASQPPSPSDREVPERARRERSTPRRPAPSPRPPTPSLDTAAVDTAAVDTSRTSPAADTTSDAAVPGPPASAESAGADSTRAGLEGEKAPSEMKTPMLKTLMLDVLQYLIARYPDAPQAERATTLRSAWQEATADAATASADSSKSQGAPNAPPSASPSAPPSTPSPDGTVTDQPAPSDTSTGRAPLREMPSKESKEEASPAGPRRKPPPRRAPRVQRDSTTSPGNASAAWTLRVEKPTAAATDATASALHAPSSGASLGAYAARCPPHASVSAADCRRSLQRAVQQTAVCPGSP